MTIPYPVDPAGNNLLKLGAEYMKGKIGVK
jgi:hypothetical protein